MAKKVKVLYCPKCGRKTVHKLAATEHPMVECTFLRAFWAIGSLGLSEILRTNYYQCSVCGYVQTIELL